MQFMSWSSEHLVEKRLVYVTALDDHLPGFALEMVMQHGMLGLV
jgi:hypothetical protein